MDTRTPTSYPASHEEDLDLLRRLALCEEDALFVLYTKYQRLVYSLALRILSSEEEAQELVQEIFLHVWAKASIFDTQRGNLDTWLLSVTHHRAVDLLRTRREKQKDSENTVDSEVLTGRSTENTVQDAQASRSPKDRERETLLTALKDLSDEQKQALELVYYEGYPISEVAKMLGVPGEVITKRVRQAMITMRTHLQREGYQVGTPSISA